MSKRLHKSPAGVAMMLLAIAMCAAAGCAHNPPGAYGSPGASPSVETPWKPPAQAVEKQKRAAQAEAVEAREAAPLIPPELLGNIQNLTLADIVNIALRNSTQTRGAWAHALAAAAAYGSRRGSYFPDIGAAASVNWQKNAAAGGRLASGERTYSVSGTIGWLLFDFGGRGASVEETREAMFAASWTHNSSIQSVILQVEQAYYSYFAAKALLAAQQATVDEAQASVNVAEDRHSAGLATIADVLQARTALSRAMLALETLQGQHMTTRGILATAMGLSANTSFDVELPIGAPPLEQTVQSVEAYLDTAMKERPDLAAARAQALEARAHIRSVAAQGYPSISASGSAGRLYLENDPTGSDSYNLTIGLSFPLFTGFSHRYDVQQAKALADAAAANARGVKDLVTLQVWTSYYNLQTANQKIRTSDDLMTSATQNQEVATGRYKAGVGSILDLLTAQSELESARAQQIQARADWWLAVAQLAYDTGTLEASDLTGRSPDSEPGKGNDSKEGKP
ncbi:MAG TPA: TolC family protein [Candidatus Krumholzibacteriaceae bacterium]